MINDIPNEVQWVWTVQYFQRYVGADTLKKIEDIIYRFPEYFPWESKYNSIPEDVHRRYKKAYDKAFLKPTKYDGKGIYAMMKEASVSKPPPKLTIKTLEKTVRDLFLYQDKRRKKEEKLEERKKKLWDKYYGPYGLESR